MSAVRISGFEDFNCLLEKLKYAPRTRPLVTDACADLRLSGLLQFLDKKGYLSRIWDEALSNSDEELDPQITDSELDALSHALESEFELSVLERSSCQIHVDRFDETILSGWAKLDENDLPVLLRILINGKHEFLIPACRCRTGLVSKGISIHGFHGFRLDLQGLGLGMPRTASVQLYGHSLGSKNLKVDRRQRSTEKKSNEARYRMITAVRDEAPFLLDWIAFHRAVGVEHFFIYHNSCTDETEELLTALSERYPWVEVYHNEVGEGERPQMRALKHFHRMFGDTEAWTFFFDCDEFLNLAEGISLEDIFDGIDPVIGAVAFNWKSFGSDQQSEFSSFPVPFRFVTCCDSREAGQSRTVKCAFRPRAVERHNIHHPDLKEGFFTQHPDRSLAEFPDEGMSTKVDWSLARLNHYTLRSKEEFAQKAIRGVGSGKWEAGKNQTVSRATYDRDFFSRIDRTCDSIDLSIAMHKPKFVLVREELLSNAEIKDLHDVACRSYKDRVRKLV